MCVCVRGRIMTVYANVYPKRVRPEYVYNFLCICVPNIVILYVVPNLLIPLKMHVRVF